MATPINQLTVKSMNEELATLMAVFCKKHGLSKGRQRITYAADGSTMKFTFECGAEDKISGTNPVWYRNGVRHGYRFGLDSKDIGSFQFKLGAKGMVTYVGMSSPRFAIIKTAKALTKV